MTIVAWSFVRTDVPLRDLLWQVAGAVREEVSDLEAAGIGIIQVDEPALRELMPLRRRDQADYLGWAVGAYRHSPRVPDRAEIEALLGRALRVLPPERLWVNPDCGLKTRTYPEIAAARDHWQRALVIYADLDLPEADQCARSSATRLLRSSNTSTSKLLTIVVY